MEILINKYVDDGEQELVIEYTFPILFKTRKFKKTYRRKNGVIMEYKGGGYYHLGAMEYINIKELFEFNPNPKV